MMSKKLMRTGPLTTSMEKANNNLFFGVTGMGKTRMAETFLGKEQ